MELTDYFDPVSLPRPLVRNVHPKDEFGKRLTIHTPDTPIPSLEGFDMALMGVPEERNSQNKGSHDAPDHIRRKLYSLGRIRNAINILDLGNMRPGSSPSDTFFGIRDIVFHLLENNVIPVILGGTQDLTLGCHEAVMKYRGRSRLLTVDARLDMDKGEEEISSDTWLKKIMEEEGNKTGYVNLGHQEYLVSLSDLDRLTRKGFRTYRLGHIRENPEYYEPFFRDADIHSFDLSAVRQSDAPGTLNPSPNGFSGNEICQLSLFSGLSDQIAVYIVSEANPRLDSRDQTAHLAAQMVWFFTSGLAQRRKETPDPADETFTQYMIDLAGTGQKITFLKSNLTERWWFLNPGSEKNNETTEWIACSYQDYLMAGKREIPERWLNLLK